MKRKLFVAFLVIAFVALLCHNSQPTRAQSRTPANDSEMLGKAIEYFQSGKFHEALLLFANLDKRYKLNPRFRAFLA
ncbi:MAG: hypothetical protein IKQ03_14415, partial [Prevotella sp.]|nr:hypothetical protein [Prevotella sp.]